MSAPTSSQPGPAAFDRADPRDLGPRLAACLAAGQWVSTMLEGRPYGSLAAIEAAAMAAARRLPEAALTEALAAHPRIGERPGGDDEAAAHSRREQAGVTDDERTAERLRRANHAYEEHFGHVFLIRAAGRTAEEVLTAAQDRLGNDPETERAVVRHELGQIAVLRLHDLLDELAERTEPTEPTGPTGPTEPAGRAETTDRAGTPPDATLTSGQGR